MLSEIDVREIFHDHFSTLTNYSEEEIRKTDLFVFFGIPAIISLALVVWCGPLPANLIVVIGTSLSVSAGLLLNLFILTYNTVMNAKKDTPPERTVVRKEFATQIISNIAFAIVISLTIVVLVLFLGITHKFISHLFALILTGFIYFFGAVFGLKMLLLLKRTYILLKGELNRVP